MKEHLLIGKSVQAENLNIFKSKPEKLPLSFETKFFKENIVMIMHPFIPVIAEKALKKCENVLFLMDQTIELKERA
jgi:valyl-tRNA synthetase